jgi:hypothetical protein
MDYQNLNWETLNLARNHLYQRLTDPLSQAINSVDLSQDTGQVQRTQNLTDAHRQLSMLYNLVKAWEALIRWKTEKQTEEFQTINPDEFPDWFLEYLSRRAIIKLEHAHLIRVCPEAFYEGVVLLVNIAEKIGELSHIMFNDAAAPRTGVWLRIVFMPRASPAYQSKQAILDLFDKNDPLATTIAFQFATASDLFELNETRFSLQNNTRTGHQAFAVLLPALATTPATDQAAHPTLAVPVAGSEASNMQRATEVPSVIPPSTPADSKSPGSKGVEVESTPQPAVNAFTAESFTTASPKAGITTEEIKLGFEPAPSVAAETLAEKAATPEPVTIIEPPTLENGMDTIPIPAVLLPEADPAQATLSRLYDMLKTESQMLKTADSAQEVTPPGNPLALLLAIYNLLEAPLSSAPLALSSSPKDRLSRIYRLMETSSVNFAEIQQTAIQLPIDTTAPTEKATRLLASVYVFLEAERDKAAKPIASEPKSLEETTTLADQIRAAIAKLSTKELSEANRTLKSEANSSDYKPLSLQSSESNQDSGASRESDSSTSSPRQN